MQMWLRSTCLKASLALPRESHLPSVTRYYELSVYKPQRPGKTARGRVLR